MWYGLKSKFFLTIFVNCESLTLPVPYEFTKIDKGCETPIAYASCTKHLFANL